MSSEQRQELIEAIRILLLRMTWRIDQMAARNALIAAEIDRLKGE